MSKFIIYGLRCPESNDCRYVGQSSTGIERARSHLNHSHNDLINAWVNYLRQKGELPIIDILEVCESINDLNDREQWWINFYNKVGLQLFNSHLKTSNNKDVVYSLDCVSKINFNIGDAIKSRRRMIGISSTELSLLANIDRTTLYQIERNNLRVGCGTIKKVSEVIGLRFGLISALENKRNILWLDDTRDPSKSDLAYGYMEDNITWVKSYDEFIKAVGKKMPDIVSFDYDLGENIAIDSVRNGMNKKDARKIKKQAKNGKDCAIWLIEYCNKNNLNLPRMNVHSSNKKGSAEIFAVIDKLV